MSFADLSSHLRLPSPWDHLIKTLGPCPLGRATFQPFLPIRFIIQVTSPNCCFNGDTSSPEGWTPSSQCIHIMAATIQKAQKHFMDRQLKAKISILQVKAFHLSPYCLSPSNSSFSSSQANWFSLVVLLGQSQDSGLTVLIPKLQVYNLFNHLFSPPEMLLLSSPCKHGLILPTLTLTLRVSRPPQPSLSELPLHMA